MKETNYALMSAQKYVSSSLPPPQTKIMPRNGVILLAIITVTATMRFSVALTNMRPSSAGNNFLPSPICAARVRHGRMKLSTTSANENSMVTTSSVIPVQLKYTEYKDKDTESDNHTPVILLHGLLGSKRNFASLGTSLTRQLQKKRRVLALDLRNHGENEHDWRETMSYVDMAEDLLQFLNDQKLEKAILVGHR